MGDMRREPYKPAIPTQSKYMGKEAIEASSYGFCAHCGRGNAKAKCGNCGQVAYCGKECQRLAWKEHKLSGYCVPHCNLCGGPTRLPDKTLKCRHRVCEICYNDYRRLGCAGYCAKCGKFHEAPEDDDEGDREARVGALKEFVYADRMDRIIRERSKTMGMSKDESQKFAALLRSATMAVEAALDKDPADFHARCILGMIKRSQGDAMGACASFADALEIQPSHASSNFYMGLIALKNGDHATAARRFRGAIKSDPRHTAAHRCLTQLLKNHETKEEARGFSESAAENAINANPHDAGCLNTYGLTLLNKGNTIAAEESFRAATRENPKHAKAHYNLGCALRLQSRYNEAETAWREALFTFAADHHVAAGLRGTRLAGVAGLAGFGGPVSAAVVCRAALSAASLVARFSLALCVGRAGRRRRWEPCCSARCCAPSARGAGPWSASCGWRPGWRR